MANLGFSSSELSLHSPQLLLVFLEAGLILGKLCTKLNRTTVENIDLIWETVELMI